MPQRWLRAAKKLAGLAGIDAAAYAKLVKASGAKAFVQAIVFRRGQAPDWALSHSVPGLRADSRAPTIEPAASTALSVP